MRIYQYSDSTITRLLRLVVLLSLAILLISWSTCIAGNKWINHGPEGGSVQLLAIDPLAPQMVYAGIGGAGVFKSTDGGNKWSSANEGLPGPFVYEMAFDRLMPQTIYAATDAGLYQSTDGGSKWNICNKGMPGISVYSLAIDPLMPQMIYAGAGGAGVFKSMDKGNNWNSINTGLPNNSRIMALAVDPVARQTVYAGTFEGRVFKSLDGGNSWNPSDTGLNATRINSLAIDPLNHQTLYVATFVSGYFPSGALFKSTDGGNQWEYVIQQYVDDIVIDPQSSQTLYVVNGTMTSGALGFVGAMKSTDSGSSWVSLGPTTSGPLVDPLSGIPTSMPIPIFHLAIDPLNPRTIYVGTYRYGVYKSMDGGNHWDATNTGLTAAEVGSVVISPTAPKTLYAGSYASVLRSTDGGHVWNSSSIEGGFYIFPPLVNILVIDPLDSQTVYAANSGLFKSTDGGINWNSITPLGIGGIKALAIDPLLPQTLYVGSYDSYRGGIYRSTDGGNSWTSIGPIKMYSTPDPFTGGQIPILFPIFSLAIDPLNSQTIYAGTDDAGIFKSMDGGTNWSAINSGLTFKRIDALVIDPVEPQKIYAIANGRMFKTTDGGSYWNEIPTIGGVLCLVIDPAMPQRIIAGTGYYICESTDGGSHWKIINTDIIGYINAVAINPLVPQTIYAATNGGIKTYTAGCSNLEINAGGVANCDLGEGDGEATKVGYATLEANQGSAPYGMAVLRLKQNGVTVSEVGVPASSPTTCARIFIDYRADVKAIAGQSGTGKVDVNTGIAVVNYGSITANVTYILRDVDGVTLATGQGSMAAGSHFAKFIDQMNAVASNFNLPADFQSTIQFGSLEISSDQPLAILALRMTVNQRNEVLFTTTPVADLAQSLSYDNIYFPQLADGGGYTTSLILLNTSNRTESGTLQILDNAGMPLAVSQAGGPADSSFKYSIPAGGLFRFQTDGFSTDTKVGWVQLIPDFLSPTPIGSGVFGYTAAGILVSESGVPTALPTTRARVYVDLSENHNTGLAIANIVGNAVDVTIKAFKTDGITSAGTGVGRLQLVWRGHDAKFADQLITGLPDGFMGVLDISSTRPFAALTLRLLYNERHDPLLTAFPIGDAQRTAPLPAIFPQIAAGDGYATEFILINVGKAASLGLHYFDETGIQTEF
jgi:photosystem II stability/assembly factor-like uncharacterized protein